MSSLDFVVPLHQSKLKLTLLLTKELAMAAPCIATSLATTYAHAKLPTSAIRKTSESTLVDEGYACKSLDPKLPDGKLLDCKLLDYKLVHCKALDIKSQDINTLDFNLEYKLLEYRLLDDHLLNMDRLAQRVSSPLDQSYLESRLANFNKSLSHFANTNIYVISSPLQLSWLLDLHYLASNTLPLSLEMFPYLHGLSTMNQRVFFHSKFNPNADLDLLCGDAASIATRFPHDTSVKVPGLGFHLMTVNTLECDAPKLINSISVDDLLTFKSSYLTNPECDDFDYTAFENFDNIYQLHDFSDSDEITTRNYRLQIKLMAPLSHFLVYNNAMNFYANSEAARAIWHLMGPQSTRAVYVVDFDINSWLQMGSYLDSSSGCHILDQDISAQKCPLRDRLTYLEQDLIWLLNGVRELFPRFFIGNVYNHQQIVSSSQRSSHYDFKLHIHCRDNAKLPSLSAIHQLFNMIESEGLEEPIHIEFPDSIARNGAKNLSPKETLRYLNVMKLINLVINKCNKKVFAYSFDGFTGITLLSLSLGILWGADSIEDVVCSVFRKPDFKFYFLQGDYTFIKNFEVYIQWFKRLPIKDFHVVLELPLSKINDSYRRYSKHIDWFKEGSDVNFPSQMYENVFLGSAEHASSITVLSALKINKIVSIDEKPSWFKYLKCTFEHEATLSTTGPIVKPIYVFNNGTARVYEIIVHSAVEGKLFQTGAPIPDVKSIIYIHNVGDDGKDSLLPLLVDCPESVQRKILVDPRDSDRALVHCRIGVSRSASLVIASVMKYFGMDVVESYMFVRVRRFNVIIQPNLRIFYELFLFDEILRKRKFGSDYRNKHCWWVVCEQIFQLNQQYMN